MEKCSDGLRSSGILFRSSQKSVSQSSCCHPRHRSSSGNSVKNQRGLYASVVLGVGPSCPGLFPLFLTRTLSGGFPHSSVSKESACNAGDLGSILGLGRSPGEGNGNVLQYSCLENPMRGAWQATIYGVTELDTTERVSTQHRTLSGRC